MSMFQELEYNVDIEKIGGVQFSILSPDEIRRRSVAEIYTNETYDSDIPKTGGLFDPRMGVLDHGKKCPTDELDNRHCPGYFGHIELAKPVFHIHFLKYTVKTLQSVCCRCSKLLISPESDELRKIINTKKGVNRFLQVSALCSKVKRCGDKNEDGCGAVQPNIIRRETTSIGKLTAIWKSTGTDKGNDSQILFEADDIERILRRISDEDVEALGFNKTMCRPEWLVCTVLPVPPPAVRPSVRADNNTRMEDDLTHKLCDILKTNKTLKYKIKQNANKKAIDEWYQLLQYHVATLINNNLPGIPPAQQRSGRPLKAIADRLKSKEGRVRGNLMGKRVDKSARSVITPDPRLKLNQLGVPIEICKNLTYAEKVNKYNKAKLLKLVRNGYYKYPGAKSIKRKTDNKIISLSVVDTQQMDIFEGDIINRHLIKGDIVLFNRQPSLHKMSMMQHEVVPLPYKTFRLNVSVTTPYNADFDGDEMNMHVPQSEQSRIELAELASVPSQIVSPANHKPIISLVQDTCVGSYLFTRYDNYLTRDEVMDILIDIPSWNGQLPEPEIKAGTPANKLPEWWPTHKYTTHKDLWSGRQIFSLVIPDINLKKKNKSYDTEENFMNMVTINNGKVKNGVFDKNILGASEHGLIHIIFNEYGKDRAQQFLDDIQNIVTNWMLKSGFSVGIGDLVPDQASTDKMKEIINEKKRNVIENIEHIHKGILENKSGKNVSQEFEIQVLSKLNRATTDTGKVALKHLNSSNRMLNMVISGSKGSDINMGQMIACVGQQAVDGKRIPYGFTDRTLPHFHKYDDGASARGFVESSFMKGLTPTEFYFHAMGGREGLIDTAVKTSETGYIQRKLIKAMEDIKVNEDYTVRSSSNIIVQFLYGGDGMDATFVESQPLLLSKLDTQGLIEMFLMKSTYNWEKVLNKSTIEELNSDKDRDKKLQDNFKNILSIYEFVVRELFANDIENNILFPVHIQRILQNKCGTKQLSKKLSDTSPLYIIEKNERLKNRCFISHNYPGNCIFKLLIDIHLSPKILIEKYRIQREDFDEIIKTIESKYFEAIISPGELVGPIAAQSIGEPATQMTLNTFHYAGVSSKSNVTRGIPRLRELLHISKHIKSPSVKIYLRDEYIGDKDKCNYIRNKLEYICLRDVVKSSEIYYDKKSSGTFDTDIEQDDEFLSIYREFESLESETNYTSPWIIRYIFDRDLMLDKAITMEDIELSINRYDTGNIKFVYSDENSKEMVGRISIKVEEFETEESGLRDQSDVVSTFKTINNDLLTNIVIGGIENIRNIVMSEIKINKRIDNEITTVNEWLLETDGTNLLKIFGNEFVDYRRTVSNDIIEIYETLGIEATRNALICEITDVVDDQGEYINSRHIELLCDVMTSTGDLISINREGIKRGNIGPLAKCSFENTTDQLIKAGIFGELDNLQGVSSNIMMGQKINAGTNNCELLLDEEKLIGLMKGDIDEHPINEVDETNIDILINNIDIDTEGCDDDDFDFTV